MTANAKSTKRHREPGTLEGLLPGESLDDFEKRVGDDAPEWTEADFARARPMREMFPEVVEAFERMRGQRGPQKTPTKERVDLRLDRDVVAYFRATGPGWQGRINDILAAHVLEIVDSWPVKAHCDASALHVTLADGRALSAPLWWYPRLLAATPAARNAVEFMPMGLHWPEIDEDISIASILRGEKAPGAVPA